MQARLWFLKIAACKLLGLKSFVKTYAFLLKGLESHREMLKQNDKTTKHN